jgi:hypothetical protein
MIITTALAVGASAQIIAVPIDHEDIQSWNETQLTVPLSVHFDFLTRLNLRFVNNLTNLNDERFVMGFVWKPSKALSISPAYIYVDDGNPPRKFRLENRFNLAATYRFPIKSFGLSHRSSIERRLRRSSRSWRYRTQLSFDKDLPVTFISKSKFFMSEEVYYDSLAKRFSRNRFSIGITKMLSPHLSLDVYYMRQNDGIARPGDLNVIGTAWKFKL